MTFEIDPNLIENNEVRLTEDGSGDLAIEHVPSGNTITVDQDVAISDIATDTLPSNLDAQGNDINNVGSVNTDDLTVTETRAYERSTKTISSGAIDATDAIWIEMSAESGSSDTLQQLTPDKDSQIVILMTGGDSITVQDASNNSISSNKFRLDGQTNKVLDAIQDRIILQHYPPTNNWHQLSYADY